MIDQSTASLLDAFQNEYIKNDSARAIKNEWYRTGAYDTMEYYAARTYNGLTLYMDVHVPTGTVTHYFWE